jgi:GNAT superfamily N-acetyltransferase
LIERFDWPDDRAVVDGFDDSLEGSRITRMLSLVGFSSPPAWRRPWRVLSNGQQFRCNLARALLMDTPLVVMDEFTSVVDRQVARFASAAIARAIRVTPEKNRQVRCGRFIAVSCHYDILQWLCPDWTLDTATGKVHWGSVQRPPIELQLFRGHQRHWPLFERHHYLSASLNPAARCYIALWQGRPVALCATMHQSASSPRRRIHRLVVLPDYQGLGIGPAVLDEVAKIESAQGQAVSIVTSHPVLIRTLSASPHWRRLRTVRCGQVHSGFLRQLGRAIGSQGRATASFLYQEHHHRTENKNHSCLERSQAPADLQALSSQHRLVSTPARTGNAQGWNQLRRDRQRDRREHHPGGTRLQACPG